ncbi:MAG: PEP-CTERM sorting domain-containing protein [Hyphomicrobiales bacterium]
MAAGCALLLASAGSYAGLITVGFTDGPPPPNACPGTFGDSFGECTVNGSPVIAKLDVEEESWETNSEFPSVTGDEFSFTGLGGASGTWSYSPTGDDPAVRYWAAKGGSEGFNFFYVVPDEFDGTCSGSFTTMCLDLALVQTAGSWSVPSGSLSNISFYDTEAPPSVPEPHSLALLCVGLLGLGLMRRRRAA